MMPCHLSYVHEPNPNFFLLLRHTLGQPCGITAQKRQKNRKFVKRFQDQTKGLIVSLRKIINLVQSVFHLV